MPIDEKKIHSGHRERMREKFREFGRDVFNTYELLEMLLYYVIPYKDTNPISKNLLNDLSSLDGVFSAERDRLMSVSGVGERVAELIRSVGSLDIDSLSEPFGARACRNFSSGFDIADHFTEYFSDKSEYSVALLLLDGDGRYITCETLYRCDCDSAAVRCEPFIDAARRNSASQAVLAHTHPYGPLFPTPADLATDRLIAEALRKVGVSVLEHYIISGKRSFAIHKGARLDLKPQPKSESAASLYAPLEAALKNAESVCAKASLEYHTPSELLTDDIYSLEEKFGAQTALCLKLFAALMSRRITDGFKLGRVKSEPEIERHLAALFIGLSEETVYMLSFDREGRALGIDRIGEGTVNFSEVLPRKIIETAKRRGALSISIAHNHPRGAAEQSEDDRIAFSELSSFCESVGLRLIKSYTVADSMVVSIGIP